MRRTLATLLTSLAPLLSLEGQAILVAGPPQVVRVDTTARLDTLSGSRYAILSWDRSASDTGRFVITARSESIDPVLRIKLPDSTEVEDDDGGGGLNARVILQKALVGRHEVRVSAFGDETGNVEVEVRRLGSIDSVMDLWPRPPLQYDVSRPNVRRLCVDSRDPNDTAGAGELGSDLLHPKTFARVLELPRRSGGSWDSAVVFASRSRTPSRGVVVQSTEVEVDRYSHLVVAWDRDALKNLAGQHNLAITVRARVESPDGSRNVEVWSYSTIGQQRRTVGTRIRTLRGLRTSTCGALQAIRSIMLSLGDMSGTTLASARQHLLLRKPELAVSLGALANPDNVPGFGIALHKGSVDPAVVTAYSQQLLARLEHVTSETRLDSLAIVQLVNQMELLQAILEPLLEVLIGPGLPGSGSRNAEAIAEEQLASQLKDGDLFVPETGARPGDRIVIEIENDALGDSIPRILKVPMRVVEYGLSQRTRDSFFFVTRLGVANANADSIASDLEEGTPQGATSTETVGAELNFAPTGGVTYGWTYYPRKTPGGDRTTAFVQWLHPGFGFNVSFPRFGDRVVAFTQADTAQGSLSSVEVTESTSSVNVAIGPVVSFFDGALQVTTGWNLSISQSRRYWGIGLSFVRLVGAVTDR